jgi:hypothetical protein
MVVEGQPVLKKKWLTWLLAAILPGFGHVYLGHWKMGLAFFMPFMATALMFVTRIPYLLLTGWGAQLFATGLSLAFMAIWAYQLADAMQLLRRMDQPVAGSG